VSLRPARGDEALEASHVRVGDGGCPRHGEPWFSRLRKQSLPGLEVRDLHGAPKGESRSPEPCTTATSSRGAWQASSEPCSGYQSFEGCVHVSSRGRSRSKASQTQRSSKQPCSGERGLRETGQPVSDGDVRRRSAAAKQRAGAGSREGSSQGGLRVEGHRSRERASGRGSRIPFTRCAVDAISVAVGAAPSVVVAVATGAREAVHGNVHGNGEEPSPDLRESPKRESRREARYASQGRRKPSRAVAARERGCSQST